MLNETKARDIQDDSREKFVDPDWTAKGERRASVTFKGLSTLWFNTGTLCNITCDGCYIDSSPKNDALVYLARAEAMRFLREAKSAPISPREIGFTGGEPFMNPDLLLMLQDALKAGFSVLVLTNAMRPMQRLKSGLLDLHRRFPGRLTLRVSLDHHTRERHEAVRGKGTWQPAIDGLKWLAVNGFDLAVAARKLWNEPEADLRAGYAGVFASIEAAIDAKDPQRLVLFPDMDGNAEVPEISDGCWRILGKRPDDMMCATSRMVVHRKGERAARVVACTLLPYQAGFDMGSTLAAATTSVALNHRHCAKFCVLGGASCSVAPAS